MSENDKWLESDRLLSLTVRCPEDGTFMSATGRMHYVANMSDWFIEYWCPTDQELITIYTPESARLAREIAGDMSSTA